MTSVDSIPLHSTRLGGSVGGHDKNRRSSTAPLPPSTPMSWPCHAAHDHAADLYSLLEAITTCIRFPRSPALTIHTRQQPHDRLGLLKAAQAAYPYPHAAQPHPCLLRHSHHHHRVHRRTHHHHRSRHPLHAVSTGVEHMVPQIHNSLLLGLASWLRIHSRKPRKSAQMQSSSSNRIACDGEDCPRDGTAARWARHVCCPEASWELTSATPIASSVSHHGSGQVTKPSSAQVSILASPELVGRSAAAHAAAAEQCDKQSSCHATRLFR